MTWLLAHPAALALAIFCARIVDVSMGTVRTILVFRGHRYVAAAIGFVEVLIWLSAAGPVLGNLSRWYLAVAFAGGFATGNIVGVWLESKLALGLELVRVISEPGDTPVSAALRDLGHDVIELAGCRSDEAPVEVLLIVERRRRMPALLAAIRRVDPEAICTVSDVKRHLSSLPPIHRGVRPAAWEIALKKR